MVSQLILTANIPHLTLCQQTKQTDAQIKMPPAVVTSDDTVLLPDHLMISWNHHLEVQHHDFAAVTHFPASPRSSGSDIAAVPDNTVIIVAASPSAPID